MGEQLYDAPSGYNDRPAHEAPLLIDEAKQQEFVKNVGYWSGAFDVDGAAKSADMSQAATTEYMKNYAPHRPVSALVQRRTRSYAAVKYERPDMTVICKSTGDVASLVVETRKPQENGSQFDRMTRVEYLIDGPLPPADNDSDPKNVETSQGENFGDVDNEVTEEPLREVDERTWVTDRRSGALVEPTTGGSTDFTNQHLWDAEDVFAELARGDWQRSLMEHNIRPRSVQ